MLENTVPRPHPPLNLEPWISYWQINHLKPLYSLCICFVYRQLKKGHTQGIHEQLAFAVCVCLLFISFFMPLALSLAQSPLYSYIPIYLFIYLCQVIALIVSCWYDQLYQNGFSVSSRGMLRCPQHVCHHYDLNLVPAGFCPSMYKGKRCIAPMWEEILISIFTPPQRNFLFHTYNVLNYKADASTHLRLAWPQILITSDMPTV